MWWPPLALTVFCVMVLSDADDSEWREVRTAQGYVRGRKDPEGGLYAFYNIPYATVPIGPDKFKAPLPGPVWLEPLDAVDKGIVCLQPANPILDNDSKAVRQENCLIANIFVPDSNDKDLPVLVSVHGGGFEIGFGNMLKPKNFVKKHKMIVVNFNYRLGVHGFLCLGTEAAPGNAGLKDQVTLLRWVNKNIANFGGNPDDVTITGGSAGSMSVHLLALSKSAEGLFNKVILESGADVGSVSIQIDPLANAITYSKMLNFTEVDDIYALEHFYKSNPLEKLITSTFADRKDATLLFSPCVERQTGDNDVILDDYPVNIIKKGTYRKLPVLIGITNMEGLIQIPNFKKWKIDMNENFTVFLPGDLQFENVREKEEVSKKVKEFYFGDKLVGEDTVLAYIDYITDTIFGYPTMRSVKLHVEAGHDQIYLYEYSFVDDSTPVAPFTEVRGATHCAQTMAVFDGNFPVTLDETDLSKEYKQMKSIIREMWYNFVVHGKPVPEGSSLPSWPPVSANGRPYMSLGQSVKLAGVLLEERARFWDDIYQKYYRHPVPPPPPPPEKHIEFGNSSVALMTYRPYSSVLGSPEAADVFHEDIEEVPTED